MKNLQEELERFPQYKDKLFIRSYILTSGEFPSIDSYPFYSNFNELKFDRYKLRVQNKLHLSYTNIKDNIYLVLIGNCINPFELVYDEDEIVKKIAKKVNLNEYNPLKTSINYINELTGNFVLILIENDKIIALTDPAGMLYGCYGCVDGQLYMSSHPQLIADIVNCSKDDYTIELEKYKFFYYYGVFFPGNRTQFKELKRLIQNHFIIIDKNNHDTVERFYPTNELIYVKNDLEYNVLIEKTIKILKDTLKCIVEKYKRPAISLSGGMDSKTTLAASNGLRNKFLFYSYNSMKGDMIDSNAAHKIANYLGIEHTIDNIPYTDENFSHIELIRSIIEHNRGNYRVNFNDVRKRAYYDNKDAFDIEIKSWVSEIARANYYKKFGKKRMPKKLTPRQMTTMYKLFITERGLVHKTDKIFDEFIKLTNFHNIPAGYDESDLYLWEFRYPAWGGLTITAEHQYSYEIIIPYNNRLLLDLLLHAPLEERISDKLHERIIKTADEKIDEIGITITNWNETKFRMWCEKTYFNFNSLFSFV